MQYCSPASGGQGIGRNFARSTDGIPRLGLPPLPASFSTIGLRTLPCPVFPRALGLPRAFALRHMPRPPSPRPSAPSRPTREQRGGVPAIAVATVRRLESSRGSRARDHLLHRAQPKAARTREPPPRSGLPFSRTRLAKGCATTCPSSLGSTLDGTETADDTGRKARLEVRLNAKTPAPCSGRTGRQRRSRCFPGAGTSGSRTLRKRAR